MAGWGKDYLQTSLVKFNLKITYYVNTSHYISILVLTTGNYEALSGQHPSKKPVFWITTWKTHTFYFSLCPIFVILRVYLGGEISKISIRWRQTGLKSEMVEFWVGAWERRYKSNTCNLFVNSNETISHHINTSQPTTFSSISQNILSILQKDMISLKIISNVNGQFDEVLIWLKWFTLEIV